MASTKIIQVIEVRSVRGKGKDESDPIRQIVEYFDFEGAKLAEQDPATYFVRDPQ